MYGWRLWSNVLFVTVVSAADRARVRPAKIGLSIEGLNVCHLVVMAFEFLSGKTGRRGGAAGFVVPSDAVMIAVAKISSSILLITSRQAG
jgi:hypothetical protein